MATTEGGLVTVYIDRKHRERLKALVAMTSPTPKLGGFVEHLIDEALKVRGVDPETLKPLRKRATA